MSVPLPVGEVFRFFEDPRNLARITPSALNFRIVNPESVHMREGAEIDYIIRWSGLPLKWKTVIRRYEPPRLFVDEQARGPYALWHHEHNFREIGGGTAIGDRVVYRLPLCLLGDIAHALIVKRQLLAIFSFRQRAIAGILGVEGITFADPVITSGPVS